MLSAIRSVSLLALLSVVACAAEGEDPVSSTRGRVTTCLTYQRGVAGTVNDTVIYQNLPNAANGTATNLWTGQTSSGVARALVRFDVSAVPPGSIVQSAQVSLYVSNAYSTTVRVHPVTSAWNEASTTWNTFQSAYDPAVIATYVTGGYGTRTFSLRDQVQAWVDGAPNHGFLLEEDPTTYRTGYGSSENATQTRRPALTVCYDDPGAPPPPPPAPPPPAGSPSIRIAVIGDYGAEGPGLEGVAEMIAGWNPDAIITTGDNIYSDAPDAFDAIVGRNYHSFISPYTGVWGAGSTTNRFWPTLGNHDVDRLADYTSFFDLPNNERYYHAPIDASSMAHFYAVNSDVREPDGVNASSAQATYIRDALAASTACFDIVAFHEPAYGSRLGHDPSAWMQWPYREWGADIVFQGHMHGYERLLVNGFPYVTQGTGGGGIWGNWTNFSPDSVYRYPVTETGWGAALVTIRVGEGTGELTVEYYPLGATTPVDTYSFTKYCP
jgi:hypothetical protein